MNNVTTSILTVLLLIAAVIFAKNVPELRRYVQMRNM